MEVIFLAFKDYFKFNKDETTFMFIEEKGGSWKNFNFFSNSIMACRTKVKKTLIVSTDPAHSLSDSLKCRLAIILEKLKQIYLQLK